jgi:hypothetical protein
MQQQRRSMEQQKELLNAVELADATGGTREQLEKMAGRRWKSYKCFLCVVQVRGADRRKTLTQK